MGGLLRRWWFWLLLVTMIPIVALFLACRHYHIYSLKGWEVYKCMERECHPAWADYNFGRATAGNDVEEVIALTNPVEVELRGRWVVLHYNKASFTGITAAALDGKMVIAYAWSCCWVRLFFDELSEEQSVELLGRSKEDPRRFGIVPVYR